MAIQRKAKPDHWVFEFSNPRLGPPLPWKTNPSFGTLQRGLGVGLLTVSLFTGEARL